MKKHYADQYCYGWYVMRYEDEHWAFFDHRIGCWYFLNGAKKIYKITYYINDKMI